jgi:hypothetical protein
VSSQDGPDGPALNPAAIVAALNRHQVRYVIIGAFAAIAEVWNLVCADGELHSSFHPSGFADGYAQLAVNAHRLRVGDVEVVVADLADVIQSKESAGRPKDLRVLPLLYRHLSARSRTGVTIRIPGFCLRRENPGPV